MKNEIRSARVNGRVKPSLKRRLTSFRRKQGWSESAALEEAVIRLVEGGV